MILKKQEEFIGVGRRKRAVAAVRVRQGTGKVDVNGLPFEEYFRLDLQRSTLLSPLTKVNVLGQFDLVIRTKGGGIEGQVVAARLGLARALVKSHPDSRALLKEAGFLRRDPRKRERKKYGLAGARKRFQFSKR